MEFFFKAKNENTGKVIKGKTSAGSEVDLGIKLRSNGFTLLSAKAVLNKQKSQSFLSKKIKAKELTLFLRQLSVLLKSGVPLLDALIAIRSSVISKPLNKMVSDLVTSISEGFSLSQSMQKHPNIFPFMVVNLIKAGEASGIIDDILMRVVTFDEKRRKLRSKVISAMIYPSITILVAILAVIAILKYVIPKFEQLFASNNKELPEITQTVISLSHSLSGPKAQVVIVLLIALPFIVSYCHKKGIGTDTMDSMLLKIPLFGELVKKSSIARMSRTLSTLLSAGIRLNEALDVTIGTVGNRSYDKLLMRAKVTVVEGKPLSTEFKRANDIIPSIVTQMVSIGEQTGNMDDMFSKIADFYEDEVEATAGQLAGLLEPIIIVVLGVIIGGLVIAMFMPILTLGDLSF